MPITTVLSTRLMRPEVELLWEPEVRREEEEEEELPGSEVRVGVTRDNPRLELYNTRPAGYRESAQVKISQA